MPHFYRSSFASKSGIFFIFLVVFSFSLSWGQYCLPTYLNDCSSGDVIDEVSFVSISNLGTGCGGPAPSNYTDYTGLVATISQGGSYPITVNSGPDWAQHIAVFIDLNADNDFLDPGEYWYLGENPAPAIPVTGTINIPLTATLGPTRMRVLSWWNNFIPQDSVCGIGMGFGEVEDYGVFITPPPANDANLSEILSPLEGCALSDSELVTIKVINFGLDTIDTLDACYSINAGTPVCETFIDTLAPGDSAIYTFAVPADLSVPGPYLFDAYVDLAGDIISYNDSITDYSAAHIPLITTFPFIEDFESTDGGFRPDDPSSSWEWGLPVGTFINGASSGLNAWVTNLGGTYPANDSSHLVTNCIDFSGLTKDPVLRFAHIFQTEGPCCTDGWIDYSTDDGLSWNRLNPVSLPAQNWYNDTIDDFWDETSGDPAVWRPASILLEGMAGMPSVRFRFGFRSPLFFFGIEEGFGVDDFEIRTDSILDIEIMDILAPATCAASATEAIGVELINYGSDTLFSLPICFRLDSGTVICDTIMDTIPPFTPYWYTFDSTGDFSAPTNHFLEIWSDAMDERYRDNDTIRRLYYPNIATFPYDENFDSWSVDDFDPVPLTGGWENSTMDGDQDWYIFSGPTTSVGTGPAGDHTTGSGNYLYVEDSGLENEEITLLSPCIDLRDTAACVSFWVHSNDANGVDTTNNSMILEVYALGGWIALDTVSHIGDFWEFHEYNLTPYSGEIVRFRFRNNNNNGTFSHDIAIDDFNVSPKASIDAEAELILSPPESACGLTDSETICFRIENNGFDTLFGPIPVTYAIGTDTVTESLIDTLVPAETVDFCFSTPADLSAIGTYTIETWVEFPGDGLGYNDTITGNSVNVPVIDTFPYFEDFETGTAFWQEYAITTSTWAFGTPAKAVINSAASGVNSWTTGGLFGTYDSNENSFVMGPCFDFTKLVPGQNWITMKIWVESEFSWDGAVLQTSIDGGTSWQNVGNLFDPLNWYNDGTIDGNPGGQQIGWTGTSLFGGGTGGWVCAWNEIDTALLSESSVLLRVAFGSDGSVEEDGFAWDDIGIGFEPPYVPDLGPDTITCGDLVLSVPVGWDSLAWSTGESDSSITVSVTDVYTVDAYDTLGCFTSDEIFVTVEPQPEPDMGEDTIVCAAFPTCLDPMSDSTLTYNWSSGETSPTACVTTAGTYSVTVTAFPGCEGADTIIVNDGPPAPTATYTLDTSACPTIRFLYSTGSPEDDVIWDFGTGFTGATDTAIHVYLSNGTYTIGLNVSNACGADSSTEDLVITCIVNLDDELGSDMSIYPNPNNGAFNIELQNVSQEDISINLYNLQGKEIYSAIDKPQGSLLIHEVQLDEVSAGVYWLQVRTGNRIGSRKVIIH